VRSRGKRVGALALWVVGTGALVLFVFSCGRVERREQEHEYEQVSALTQHLPDYLRIPARKSLQHAYIAGKVIPVNLNTREIDQDIYQRLPREIRAVSPEEVGTVVLVEYKSSLAARYTLGGKGYVTTCHVAIIDKARATIVGEREFCGSAPPLTKQYGVDAHGSRPTGEIVRYLKDLPRGRPLWAG